MELPFYLKTLPPEALEIIRYYKRLGNTVAFTDAIIQSTGLSERGFGKAIRRLVTKGYLVLDGDQQYRLTELGQLAVSELPESDGQNPEPAPEEPARQRIVEREVVLAAPAALVADKPATITVGFAPASGEARDTGSLDVLLRLSVLNGQPATAQETSLIVGSRAAKQTFTVTAGRFKQARLRLQIYQTGDALDEAYSCGGMYVDLDVLPPGATARDDQLAYRTTARFIVGE